MSGDDTPAALPSLAEVAGRGRLVERHRPWPRHVVDAETWVALAEGLVAGRWALFGLWGEPAAVHMALLDEASRTLTIASFECPDGRFPSVGRLHAAAMRPERAIRDLYGLDPVGLPDGRPWLDHGRWGVRHPLGTPEPAPLPPEPYAFLTSEGEGLHQIPVGPVHAGIIEPGHFRFTANGETVVRLEERLGYVHKGIEGLMAGASLDKVARLAGRTSGDSTVAYSIAFARAVEAASGTAPPPRAVWLRGLMAELERLANHLGDIGAVCNDAAFALLHAHTGALRERVLRASAAAFGHRLMMDRVVPGGVAVDLDAAGAAAIGEAIATVAAAFPDLVTLYDETPSLQDRTVGTGIARADLVRRFGCGGFVGRGSGRDFDARRDLAYPPYDTLSFAVPMLTRCDVDARVWVRIREVEASLSLVEAMLERLPEGPVRVPIEAGGGGEGMAVAEAFRGDVLAWVRLAGDGTVARCQLRDASWFQWPVLEAAIEGNIVADFPLLNKSFNCSYSGHDL
jgi:Ni,Fe-hydrogenase III large subunit